MPSATTILALLHSYWPGNEATGPVQSLSALMHLLSEEFSFKALACQRGPAAEAFKGSEWKQLPFGEIRYLPVGRLGAKGLDQVLRETPHDLMMLNSFFDPALTIPTLVLRRLKRIPHRPTILSPRGEFSPAALAHSSACKRAYLHLGRRLGLFDDIWLHATAEHETEDFMRAGFAKSQIILAPDTRTLPEIREAKGTDHAGEPLRLVFLGRLTPMKNIDFALQVLSCVQVPVEFDLYGPIIDAAYWSQCEAGIAKLPAHIRVTPKGLLPHEAVVNTLSDYDLFFMPTRGENFGHAIFEALAAGLPVLISDRTPWQDLEENGCGWSLPLAASERFVETIDDYQRLPIEKRREMRQAARLRAERDAIESGVKAKNVEMFRTVLAAEKSS